MPILCLWARADPLATQDESSTLYLGIRAAQLFLCVVNLFIYIAIAVFQQHWGTSVRGTDRLCLYIPPGVGPSFLTALALCINVAGIILASLYRACRRFLNLLTHSQWALLSSTTVSRQPAQLSETSGRCASL